LVVESVAQVSRLISPALVGLALSRIARPFGPFGFLL
jgi:hypothetical protein